MFDTMMQTMYNIGKFTGGGLCLYVRNAVKSLSDIETGLRLSIIVLKNANILMLLKNRVCGVVNRFWLNDIYLGQNDIAQYHAEIKHIGNVKKIDQKLFVLKMQYILLHLLMGKALFLFGSMQEGEWLEGLDTCL